MHSKLGFGSNVKKFSCSWMKASLLQQHILLREAASLLIHQEKENLHKFMGDNHGIESIALMQEWDKWDIKDSDYKNH